MRFSLDGHSWLVSLGILVDFLRGCLLRLILESPIGKGFCPTARSDAGVDSLSILSEVMFRFGTALLESRD